jgi:hypothetical protein
MLKIGIVGDCSQGDPALLAKALDGALSVADVVVHVGDINSSDGVSGYNAVASRLGTGKLLAVPGNHDIMGPGNWDAHLTGVPKTWRKDFPEATLIGLDNSVEPAAFSPDSWTLLNAYQALPKPLFLFAHKALSPLILLEEPSRATSWEKDLPTRTHKN